MLVAALYIVFILCAFFQFLYLYWVFSPLKNYKSKNTVSDSKNPAWPRVSILIIVKNEIDNLRVLIPLLVDQHYHGILDVYIVDDHSMDDTASSISGMISQSNINIFYHKLPEEVKGKKQGLSYALHLPTSELLLLTDADCRPASPYWVSAMVDALGSHDIVLGYSPYEFMPGRLNTVIQLETMYTALLYLGLTLKGQSYMGVGRNVLYRKSVLLKSENRSKYNHVLSGDDDLTINELSRLHPVTIQFKPDAFVHTRPKATWSDWLKQKSRHVSTARHYRLIHQIILMFFYSCLLLSWLIPLGVVWCSPWIGLLWLFIKGWYYLKLKVLLTSTLRLHLNFMDWLIAEGLYVFSLLWLSPYGVLKKPLKW